MKQQTIEEAIERQFPIIKELEHSIEYKASIAERKLAFIFGARWQQKQEIKYNEEIIDILDNVRYWETCPNKYKIIIEEWFGQFKK